MLGAAPTATSTASADTVGAVVELQAGGPPVVGGDLGHDGFQAQIHAVLAVQVGEHLGRPRGPSAASSGSFGGLDDGDVDAALPRVGSDLQADPSRTDDRQRRAVGQD